MDIWTTGKIEEYFWFDGMKLEGGNFVIMMNLRLDKSYNLLLLNEEENYETS